MNAPRPALRDRLCVAGFLLVWLLPEAYHALWRAPLAIEPAVLHDWHDIACLFPNRPPVWNIYYVEIRRARHTVWEQLDETVDFGLEPFGHRTRLHRFLVAWGAQHKPGHDEVAEYLVARERERHPDRAPIVGLRFVWTGFVPKADSPAQGEWTRPALADVPHDRRRILAVHSFVERTP